MIVVLKSHKSSEEAVSTGTDMWGFSSPSVPILQGTDVCPQESSIYVICVMRSEIC